MKRTLAAALMLVAGAGPVWSQARTYACAKGSAITLTVTGPNSIKAGPIEGGTMAMRQSASNPLRYSSGDYAVQLSPDQSQITVEIPDWGSAKCSVRPQGDTQAGRPGLGNTDPCGPGYRQAPQTDRCDPIPGMSGEKARTAGLAGMFPVAGQSLGGIVRGAPSQSAPKVASLAEGAPVTIIARDISWDGYDWFKVSFGGQTGYQWGGIMCSRHPLKGVLRQCDQP